MGIDHRSTALCRGRIERRRQDLVSGAGDRELASQQVLHAISVGKGINQSPRRYRLTGLQHMGVFLLVGVQTECFDSEVHVDEGTWLDHHIARSPGEVCVGGTGRTTLYGDRGVGPAEPSCIGHRLAVPPRQIGGRRSSRRNGLMGQTPTQDPMRYRTDLVVCLGLPENPGLQPADRSRFR